MIAASHIVTKVKQALGEETEIEVFDLTGTQDHYRAVVVSTRFAGLNLLKRHRLIYGALAEEMKGPIHALTLETFTPEEWSQRG